MPSHKSFFQNYGFSLLLIGSIVFGSILGLFLKEKAAVLKPLGDVFLNLLFTIVVPLVFFSISSAVASMKDIRRLGKVMGWMMLIFIVTGIISSLLMVIGVKIFPPAQGMSIDFPYAVSSETPAIMTQIVNAFTVSDFTQLLSKKSMLALIIFSFIVGLAASASQEKGRAFTQFLISGADVMIKAVSFVMLYAPIGLGAYFAYLAGVFGPELFGSYLRAVMIYYPLALLYFFIGFSLYAYFAAGKFGVQKFWTKIIPTALTAWGTGSSVATIPTNLKAAQEIGVPEDIREVVIPIGATIHMDGSCLAAVLKISILFGLFQMDFSGAGTIAAVVCVALLSGTVISGIPSGGMIGEMLIITLFGFPIEALPIITMVGTLVDPPATMINAVGDNVSSMMVARVVNGKDWMEENSIKVQGART